MKPHHVALSRLEDFLSLTPPSVSFEFFPPKTPEAEASLWQSVEQLAPLHPQFVSVTYGAGGGTRERTHQTLKRILDETSLSPAAHLTCVCHSQSEIEEIARRYWEMGVRHIVALRGDVPNQTGPYVPQADGYAYAVDLVKGLKKIADFEISVAAYAETHPEAISPEDDLENLKRKIDAGATRAITQYFFDCDLYLRFLERTAAAGITVPIVPGITPIHSYPQIVRFSKMCGASIPYWVTDLLHELDGKPELHQLVAVTIAVEQCRILMQNGVNVMHFYTLNRWQLTAAVCHFLGIRPAEKKAN